MKRRDFLCTVPFYLRRPVPAVIQFFPSDRNNEWIVITRGMKSISFPSSDNMQEDMKRIVAYSDDQDAIASVPRWWSGRFPADVEHTHFGFKMKVLPLETKMCRLEVGLNREKIVDKWDDSDE